MPTLRRSWRVKADAEMRWVEYTADNQRFRTTSWNIWTCVFHPTELSQYRNESNRLYLMLDNFSDNTEKQNENLNWNKARFFYKLSAFLQLANNVKHQWTDSKMSSI